MWERVLTRRRASFKIGLAATLAILPVGCGQAASGDPSLPTYRYRMTVEVDTPQGLRTGSSVIEVASNIASKNALTSPGLLTTHVRGEAVAVDLPGGQVLFALLSRPDQVDGASYYPLMAMPPPPAGIRDNYTKTLQRLIRWRGVGTLPPSYYPMLVRFDDIRNATTIQAVDPTDLTAFFGKGIRLRQINIRVTNDAVTSGIEEKLVWLPSLSDGGAISWKTTRHPARPEIDLGYIDLKRIDRQSIQ